MYKDSKYKLKKQLVFILFSFYIFNLIKIVNSFL